MNGGTYIWEGRSGAVYHYTVARITYGGSGKSSGLDSVAGNYIFARESGRGYEALYVGQTSDLSERINDHEEWDCVQSRGVTHIHYHRNDGGERMRRDEETDLIRRWRPPCNG